jgi:hypothetical protein
VSQTAQITPQATIILKALTVRQLVWDCPQMCYRDHRRQSAQPTMTQITPVHTLPLYVLKTHLNFFPFALFIPCNTTKSATRLTPTSAVFYNLCVQSST